MVEVTEESSYRVITEEGIAQLKQRVGLVFSRRRHRSDDTRWSSVIGYVPGTRECSMGKQC